MPVIARYILLALTAAALVAPATAPAANIKSLWGPTTLPNGTSAFSTYKELGVENLQMVLPWDGVAATQPANQTDPNDPAYKWPAEVDAAVTQARAAGIDITLLVIRAPQWANGRTDSRYPPTSTQTYANFLTAATKRYPTVHHWEIWGEPNRDVQWLPQSKRSTPRAYAKLLDKSYATLKAASSRNIVIGGMTFTAGDVLPGDWVRYMKLSNGKPPRLDWYGHNPFSTRFPNLKGKPIFGKNRDFNDLDTLHDELEKLYKGKLRQFRRAGPPLWLSEFTIQSGHSSKEFNFFVSDNEQAKWLSAAFRIADRTSWIKGIGWIQLLDDPETGSDDNGQLGLTTYLGVKKPSFSAYRRAR